MTSREKFEAVFSKPPYEFRMDWGNEDTAWPETYISYRTMCAWDGWKDGASSRDKEIEILKARVRMYEHALTDHLTDCAISLNGNLVYPENMTDAQVMEWAERNPE